MTITIRSATTDDVSALAHIHIEGWKAAYGGIINQDYLDSLNENDRALDWQKWMADEKFGINALIACDNNNKPVGFCSFGKLKTPLPGMSPIRPLYSAEIYALYLLPDYWQQGIGRRLMQDTVLALREIKHRSLCLWVLQKNSRAVAFYKKMSGERCGKKDVEIGGSKARDICFGWRDTRLIINE